MSKIYQMPLTISEENHLKAIFKLSQKSGGRVSTNDISKEMNTAAASVTDMIQRLAEKGYVDYKRYKGTQLSEDGMQTAMKLVRKHRLWEVFLHDKLQFGWEEVHDIAEQLEHIQSTQLTDRLDRFLGFPKFDPHGDPIPSANGSFTIRNQIELSKLEVEDHGLVVGVKEHSTDFLKMLEKLDLLLGRRIHVITKHDFDRSMEVQLDNGANISVSNDVASNVFIKPI